MFGEYTPLSVKKEPGNHRRALLFPTSLTTLEGAPVSGGVGKMNALEEMNELHEFENESLAKGSV